MERNLTLIPQMSILPTRIVRFNYALWEPSPPPRNRYSTFSDYLETSQNTTESAPASPNQNFIESTRKAQGIISRHAQRKISKAIDFLLFISPTKKVRNPASLKIVSFRLSFLTFTLPSPQIHTDKEITQGCFHQMLVELKKYHGVKNYLWRAEKQANGNIHYHLITNKFILYTDVRDRWNRIINKLGYVDRYTESMKKFHSKGFKFRPELSGKWSYSKQKQAYINGKKTGFKHPNSTDIHSLRKIKNLRNYLTKYVSKNAKVNPEMSQEEREKLLVNGRLWSADYQLLNAEPVKMDVDSEVDSMLERIEGAKGVKVYHDDFFSCYYFDIRELAGTNFDYILNYFQRYVSDHFELPINKLIF